MKCRIVNAEKEVENLTDVEFISLRGSEGELGIMQGHAPLLTRIEPGPLLIRQPDELVSTYFIAGGILEVQPDEVTILADVIEEPSADDEQALLGEERSLREKAQGTDLDSELIAQLARIRAQMLTLQVAKQNRKKKS